MSTPETLAFIALGAVLGAAGQGVRAVIGVKKAMDAAKEARRGEWFDGRRMVWSFIIGAVAGVVAAVWQYAPDVAISRSLLLGFAAAGYAGTDFISGALQKWLPKA